MNKDLTDPENVEIKPAVTGISVWGSVKLVFFLILYETLFTFLGLAMNTIFKKAMGVSMEENLLASIFQVFAYLFFIKRIAVKREYEIKVRGRWDALDIGFLVLLLVGYIFVYDNTLGNLVSQTFQEKDVIDTLNNLVNSKVIGFVALLMIAPIFEEIICRGIILEQLKKRYNAVIAIFVSSLIFGLIHMNFNQGINAFFIGAIFGMAYVKTNSLIPSILLHFANNGIYYGLSFIGEISINIPTWSYILAGAGMVVLGLAGFFLRRTKKIEDVEFVEKEKSSFKTMAYRFLNLKVFGAELFSYSVFWKLVFATMVMSLISNLLNGAVKYGKNTSGFIVFILLILLVLSFDWILEKLTINRTPIHYFVFILTIIIGATIASFGAKGIFMQLWSPMLEGIGMTIFGAVGVVMAGIKSEKALKEKQAE